MFAHEDRAFCERRLGDILRVGNVPGKPA